MIHASWRSVAAIVSWWRASSPHFRRILFRFSSSILSSALFFCSLDFFLSTGFGFFLFSTDLFLSAFFKPFFASFSDAVLLSLLESDLSFSRKLCVKRLLFLFVELSALTLELILEARSIGRHERKTFLGCQIVLPVGSHLLHSDVFHLFHENSSGSRLFSVVFFHFRDFSKPLRSLVVIEASLDFLELFLIVSLDFLEFLDTLLEELVQIDGQ